MITRYRGAHPSQFFQRPHHLDAEPAMLGRPCSSHARPLAPQETLVGRTPTWQMLSLKPEEALQRHSQSVTESLWHQPQLVGASSYGQTKVAGICSEAQSPMKPTGLLQLSNAGKTGKAEHTEPEPSERGLASAPTGTASPSPRMTRLASLN